MKIEPLDRCFLIGAGEHARVVAEAMAGSEWQLVGCFGRAPADSPLPVLGDEPAAGPLPDGSYHVAFVGQPGSRNRRACIARLREREASWATIVHPQAWVSPSARLGAGVFVGARAVVQAGAEIADHAVINSGAVIEHDVHIGVGTHIAPAAAIGGGTRIGAWSNCGLGCRIRDHLELGTDILVGMGAVVVANVPDGQFVRGMPARAVGTE